MQGISSCSLDYRKSNVMPWPRFTYHTWLHHDISWLYMSISLHICVMIYRTVYVYIYTYVYTCLFTYSSIYLYTYVHDIRVSFTCMYKYKCIMCPFSQHTCVCVCVFVYSVHTHTYIYIHTWLWVKSWYPFCSHPPNGQSRFVQLLGCSSTTFLGRLIMTRHNENKANLLNKYTNKTAKTERCDWRGRHQIFVANPGMSTNEILQGMRDKARCGFCQLVLQGRLVVLIIHGWNPWSVMGKWQVWKRISGSSWLVMSGGHLMIDGH